MFYSILFLYLGLVALLYFKQRDLIYFPYKETPQAQSGAEVIQVTTQDGLTLNGFYVPPSSPNKEVLVYFHGNGGHHGHRFYKVEAYLDAGYGVLFAGYRGYGGNPGAPSEQGFYHDGRAYMDWAKDIRGIPAERIILYGESIGSGTAVQMATEYKSAAMILETPFDSLVDVAAKKYFFVPVRLLLKDYFMNIDKIESIERPLLIMHSHKDQTIPFSNAKRLYERAKAPKKMAEFSDGGHNNLYEHGSHSVVLDFLSGINPQNGDNGSSVK